MYFKILMLLCLINNSYSQAVIADYKYSLKFNQSAKVVINGDDKNLVDVEAIVSLVIINN